MAEFVNPFANPSLADLSRRFDAHARIYRGATSQNASPLYATLSSQIALDADILTLVRDADRATQVSNLLFGAVHFLLLGGVEHPLSQFYASLVSNPQPPEQAFAPFSDFCRQHATDIERLVITRRVQTNEVQRCTGLLPAFTLTAERHQNQPLALLEIGASAGLNLFWDRYGYHYDRGGRVGSLESPVQLSCDVLGQLQLPLPTTLPSITTRMGIDLMPIDVRDEDAVRWVRALIWPEHTDRAALFARAVALAQDNPPQLIAGNAADILEQALSAIPEDMYLCIYHSYTLNQCPAEIRDRILAILQEYKAVRPFTRISLEWYGGQGQPQLELYEYSASSVQSDLLAYCESHGRAIEWLYSTA